MPSSHGPLTDPKILKQIGGHMSPVNLCSLVLTNKLLNDVLTPLLYEAVVLDEPVSMLKCMRTLAAAAGSRAFSRDLAAMVHSFTLSICETAPLPTDAHLYGRSLLACVIRMVNLRHFSCSLPLPYAPSVLTALINGPRPMLESIDLVVPRARSVKQIMRPQSSMEHTRLPALHTLTLDVWEPLERDLARSVKSLLRLRADSLQSLGLITTLAQEDKDILNPLLPSDVTFTALEALKVERSALAHPSLQQTASIRSLQVRDRPLYEEEDTGYRIPQDAFPSLEVLACPNPMLPMFFPENPQYRRPIRTVRFNSASYQMQPDDYCGDETDWYELVEILPLFERSAVPVRDLSFIAMDRDLPLDDLPKALPYMSALERLVIVYADNFDNPREYLTQLGSHLIAHLPCLHTFLLSDAPLKAQGEEFGHTQNIRLQYSVLVEYEKHSSTLRNVALSPAFGWEKRGAGMWLMTGPARFS